MRKLWNRGHYNYKVVFAIIAVLLMILVGFITVWNEQSLSNSYQQNPLPNYVCRPEPFNPPENSSINGNLTIISKGLINGSAWTASIEDKNYTTNQSILKISLPVGNYTIKFSSSQRYGEPRSVNLNESGMSIIENFYRMVNLSCSLTSFSSTFRADSFGNMTLVIEKNCIELYRYAHGLSREFISIPHSYGKNFDFAGWNGKYFVLGGQCLWNTGISLVSFHPYSSYVNCDGKWYFPNQYTNSGLNGYSLTSMSVGNNEVFISGVGDSYKSYFNTFGVLNLTNSEYTNITAEFPMTSHSKVTSWYGGGSFIVEIGNEWYILNGKTLKVKHLEDISKVISTSANNSGEIQQSNDIAFNGSTFFIANASRIVSYNPENNTTKCVFSVSNSMRISFIYANNTIVMAGVYNASDNFSLVVIKSKAPNDTFFESTKANRIVGPNISYMSTYGNIIIFIGSNISGKGGAFYIFTDKSFGITFREYGLPQGIEWDVQIGPVLITTTNPCITIDNLSSGLYYYYVGSSSNFNSSLQEGHFCYKNGMPVNIFVSFSLTFSFVVKNFTMNPEYGELRITLNGLNQNNIGQRVLCYLPTGLIISYLPSGFNRQIKISTSLMYGEYSFYAIYTQSFTKAISGYIFVNQTNSYKILNFVRAKSIISFNMENNISGQYCWMVDASTGNVVNNGGCLLGSSNETAIKGFGKENVSVELRDGWYSYSIMIPSNKYGQNGHNIIDGSFDVSGSNLTINITFQTKYPVYIEEKGIHGYHFESCIDIPPWSFTIHRIEGNRSVQCSCKNFLWYSRSCVCLPNGTYVGKAAECERQYNTATPNETFTVNGSSLNISFEFVPYTYSVFVNESGLDGPYKWYINSTFGNYCGLAGKPITIYEINGTYTFTVTTNTKTYIGQQYTYNGCLWGANTTYNVTFVRSAKVKVIQNGIPQGFRWYLNLTNQRPLCSYNSTATAYYPAGNFNFTAASWGNIYSTHLMTNHTFTVFNNSVLRLIFRPYNYSIYYEATYFGNVDYNYSFIVTGGYLNLHETFYSNASFDVVLHLQNGTYNYTVVSSNNAFRNITGTLYVQGFSYYYLLLHFRMFLFNETFIETGLEGKINWGITIRGKNDIVYHLLGSGSFTTFELHNGTYYLTANTSSGNYYTNVFNRTYIINTTNPVIHIKFYAIESPDSQLLNLYGNLGISQYISFLFMGMITGGSFLTYLWKKRTFK